MQHISIYNEGNESRSFFCSKKRITLLKKMYSCLQICYFKDKRNSFNCLFFSNSPTSFVLHCENWWWSDFAFCKFKKTEKLLQFHVALQSFRWKFGHSVWTWTTFGQRSDEIRETEANSRMQSGYKKRQLGGRWSLLLQTILIGTPCRTGLAGSPVCHHQWVFEPQDL